MAAEGNNPPGMNELSAKVDRLTEQLESVLSWIQSQSKPPPKAHETPLKERFEDEASSKHDEEDDRESVYDIKSGRGSQRPFKVEARIDIPTYDGTVNAEKLDSWIDQLETYFTLYGFKSTEKVSFARLKLTSHALAWWNSYLKTVAEEEVRWAEFTRYLRQQFYPMGYLQDRWTRWHNLRQQRDQSVQEYTTEFRRLAISLGIRVDNEETLTKYVAGLSKQIQTELCLYPATSVSTASSIAMTIERKLKTSGQKVDGVRKNESIGLPRKECERVGATTSSHNSNFCEYCKIEGHVKDKCWKANPSLFPKKWAKSDRGKNIVASAIANDTIELGQVEEVDKSLALMMQPKVKQPNKEKEELFNLKIQVKQHVVEAIIDTGSEKNLISVSLVQELGLETMPHPHPYSLGWIKKDVDTQVSQQCKFRFAITNLYIDEVICEVVPLDICHVILGNPYLWERDAIYYRRAQQYQFTKDGKKYIINRSKTTKSIDLVAACPARRPSATKGFTKDVSETKLSRVQS